MLGIALNVLMHLALVHVRSVVSSESEKAVVSLEVFMMVERMTLPVLILSLVEGVVGGCSEGGL